MIPLLHLTTTFSTLFCLFAIIRLYISYRETKSENVGNFIKTFIALGLYFVVVSLPGMVISNPFWVQVFYIFSYIPIFLSPIFLLNVAFNIYHLPGKKYVFPVVLSFVILSTTLNILFFSPAKAISPHPLVYYWSETTPLWLRSLNGGLMVLLGITCVLFFLIGGARSEDRLVRARSFLISGGILILVSGGITNYVLAFHFSGATKAGLLFSGGFLSIFSLIVMLAGIYYKRKSPD